MVSTFWLGGARAVSPGGGWWVSQMVGGGQGLDFSPVGFELLRDACEGMIQAAGSGVRGKVSAADRKLGVTGSIKEAIRCIVLCVRHFKQGKNK